ncbi:hypothetical protein GCM10009813_07890 [Brevibacterium marinum]
MSISNSKVCTTMLPLIECVNEDHVAVEVYDLEWQMKHGAQGPWSRRITDDRWLVYLWTSMVS